MKHLKQTVVLLALLVAGLSVLPAEQFFKTGVVDLARIFTQFYKDTKPVKELEEFKAGIQKEVDRMKEEILQVNDQRKDAKEKGDTARFNQLDLEIQNRQAAMLDYAKTQQALINAKNAELQTDGAFQKLVSLEIEQAAISRGFGLILNLKDASIVWYAADVDITEDVIARLAAD